MLNLELIGEGATAKIYRDGNKAVKLYVNAPPHEAENEARLQAFAYDAGLPVPAVYGSHRISETETVFEMEYIPGLPFMHGGMDKDERNAAIQKLAQLQCEVHRINATGLPSQADRWRWKIRGVDRLDERIKERLLQLSYELEDGETNLCHGDFHPLNILCDGERCHIIDWVDASAGSPLADACRTYVIFKQYMSRSAGLYLRAFCKEAKAKQEDVLKWLPVVAAARMHETKGERENKFLVETIEAWGRG